MITFFVATCGLETSIDEALTEEEYFTRAPEEFAPNRHWFSVTVNSEEDRDNWIRAYNSMLEGQWTPNQTSEERNYFAKQIEKARKEMFSLEV
jgi:hypothetical protein